MNVGELRDLAEQRERGHCARCGGSLYGSYGWSLHHRKPRGMGASRRTVHLLNVPSNVVAVCGSGTTGCHGEIESMRSLAYEQGWLVHRWDDPLEKPIWAYKAWGSAQTVYLTDDGTLEDPPEHVRRLRTLDPELLKGDDPREPYQPPQADRVDDPRGEAPGPLGPPTGLPRSRGGEGPH